MDFRVQASCFQHPKIIKLRRRLAGDGLVSLFQLWAYCTTDCSTGILAGMNAEDIEIAAGWPGEPGALVSTLVDLRLLDVVDDVYRIHDWAENNPYAASFLKRRARSKAALAVRWSKKVAARTSKGEPDRFEEWLDEIFLPAYPAPHRNEQRPGALACLRKMNPTPAELEGFMRSLEAWKRTANWSKDGGTFAPGPGNFFKNDLHKKAPPTVANGATSAPPDSREVMQRQREAAE